MGMDIPLSQFLKPYKTEEASQLFFGSVGAVGHFARIKTGALISRQGLRGDPGIEECTCPAVFVGFFIIPRQFPAEVYTDNIIGTLAVKLVLVFRSDYVIGRGKKVFS